SPGMVLPSSQSSPSSTPSPQDLAQADPGGHLGSAWHVPEQPSNGMVLPSSHPSRPSFLPSPHLVVWHSVDGFPVQLQPAAHRQLGAQAFSMSATLKAGSHCSPAITMPSPQMGTQG